MKNKRIVTIIAGLLFGVCLSSCGGKIDETATLIRAKDQDATISLGYANFVAKYTQSSYDISFSSYFGDNMWEEEMTSSGTTFETQVKNSILENLKKNYVQDLHQKEYQVALSKDDEKAIEKAADSFIKDNSSEALLAMGASKEYVIEYLRQETIANGMQKAIEAEANVSVTKEETEQRTISYAYISTTPDVNENGEQEDLSEEELAQRKENAQAIAQAEDFEAMAEEKGVEIQSYSYTIAENPEEESIVPATVIEKANALAEAERSDVIEVEEKGYYIVRMDAQLDAEATAEKEEQLLSAKKTEYYNEVIDNWVGEIEWTIDEKAWSKVRFTQMFQQKATNEESE